MKSPQPEKTDHFQRIYLSGRWIQSGGPVLRISLRLLIENAGGAAAETVGMKMVLMTDAPNQTETASKLTTRMERKTESSVSGHLEHVRDHPAVRETLFIAEVLVMPLQRDRTRRPDEMAPQL